MSVINHNYVDYVTEGSSKVMHAFLHEPTNYIHLANYDLGIYLASFMRPAYFMFCFLKDTLNSSEFGGLFYNA